MPGFIGCSSLDINLSKNVLNKLYNNHHLKTEQLPAPLNSIFIRSLKDATFFIGRESVEVLKES